MRESLSQNPLSSQTNKTDDNEIDSKLFIGKASADPNLNKRDRDKEIVYQINASRTKKRVWMSIEKDERKRKRREFEETKFERGLQNEVFEHIDKENRKSASEAKLVCWSFENFHLKRKFCAASYEKFWEYYEILEKDERHHYEIIRENEPCHLYFDLEFNIHANPGIDGVKSTDALLDLIKEELYEKHNIAIELNKHVVELESIGTDNANKKFSRHVIIRLPGAAFKSNIHVGKFVKDF